jgi:hypothetical protein
MRRRAMNWFSRAFIGCAAAILGCSIALGQQPNPAPSATVPSDQSQSSSSSATSSSSSTSAPRFWGNPDPNAQVTVLENTLIRVMTTAPISARTTRQGEPLLFTFNEDVVVDGVLIVPRGATLRGTVLQSRKAGRLSGSPDLILELDSLDFGGRSYPIYTYQFKAVGTSKTQPTEAKIRDGAVIGAIAGAALSGSAHGETTGAGKLAGMGTGAALGAGVGTAVAAVTPGPVLTIPAESQIDFYLSSPISVRPATAAEAARLSQGLHAGGPVLYVRGDTP